MTRKEFFIIAIITFITFLSWVSFDILHKRSQVEILPSWQQIIEPINPNFDTDAIKLLP